MFSVKLIGLRDRNDLRPVVVVVVVVVVYFGLSLRDYCHSCEHFPGYKIIVTCVSYVYENIGLNTYAIYGTIM